MPATPPDGAEPTDASAHLQVSRLVDGYLATQLLYIAAKLGIADVLASGPLAADALIRYVGAELDVLRRVLRGRRPKACSTSTPTGA